MVTLIWFCRMLVFILVSIPLVGSAESSKDITVSAAISLKNAFEEIGKVYERQHGSKAIFNFGASGELVTQIAGGAPVDVFTPAAQTDMDEAERRGLVVASTRADFAMNSIVLIVPSGSKTLVRSFRDLISGDIKKLAVGNPKTVPAGRYAEEVFNFYQILPSVADKLIFTENVRQVLDYVSRNEVDAGVVYATDAAMARKETKIVATAPETSHRQVVYSIAVVKGTGNMAAAEAFIKLVVSREGSIILQKYGFKTFR